MFDSQLQGIAPLLQLGSSSRLQRAFSVTDIIFPPDPFPLPVGTATLADRLVFWQINRGDADGGRAEWSRLFGVNPA